MKKIMIFLIAMILVPINAKAITGSLSISCTPEEVKPGQNVVCNVSGSSPSPGVLDIDSTVTLSSGLSYETMDVDGEPYYLKYKNYWQGEHKDILDGKLGAYREDAAIDNFNFATFTLKVAENATGNLNVTISNIEFCYEKDCANVSDVSATIRVAEEEEPEVVPELKSMTASSDGVLSPSFSKSVTLYRFDLNSSETSKFSLNVSPEDDSYTVSAINTDTGASINLSNDITFTASDDKTMSITITVSNGDKHTDYVVLVFRPKPNEVGEATLSTLLVGGIAINLRSGVYTYDVTLSKDIIDSGFVVAAELTDRDNFKFSDYSKGLINTKLYSDAPLEIRIEPKVAGSGYGSNSYLINIITSGNNNPSSTPSPSSRDVVHNPNTGRTSGVVMGIILIVSFFASIYYYKKNMSEYN